MISRVLTKSAITLFLLAGSLTACTQVVVRPQTATCKNTDWFEVGRTDGLAGNPPETVKSYKSRCDGRDAVDEELYTNGRNVGLLEYCTPAAGLQAAKDGKTYKKVCPEYLEPQFLTGFQLGERIHKLETENAQVETRLDSLSQELSNPASDDETETTPPNETQTEIQKAKQKEVDELRSRRAQIDNEISVLESQIF